MQLPAARRRRARDVTLIGEGVRRSPRSCTTRRRSRTRGLVTAVAAAAQARRRQRAPAGRRRRARAATWRPRGGGWWRRATRSAAAWESSCGEGPEARLAEVATRLERLAAVPGGEAARQLPAPDRRGGDQPGAAAGVRPGHPAAHAHRGRAAPRAGGARRAVERPGRASTCPTAASRRRRSSSRTSSARRRWRTSPSTRTRRTARVTVVASERRAPGRGRRRRRRWRGRAARLRPARSRGPRRGARRAAARGEPGAAAGRASRRCCRRTGERRLLIWDDRAVVYRVVAWTVALAAAAVTVAIVARRAGRLARRGLGARA